MDFRHRSGEILKRGVGYLIADKYKRCSAKEFAEEEILRRVQGDFAVDNFDHFLWHLEHTVSSAWVKKIYEINRSRSERGASLLNQEETIDLLESHILSSEVGTGARVKITFTGFWKRKESPTVIPS